MKFWVDLAVETVRDPKAVAERIMAWDLNRNTLYMVLVAVAAVNALLASGPVVLNPASVDPAMRAALPILALLERPLIFFVLVAGMLVVSVHALYWAGRAMGGQGSLSDMLALIVWLQALRAVAQVVMLVVGLAMPFLAGLMALALQIAVFWVFLNFVSAGMRFGSLWRAFGLLVAVATGLLVGMMLIATLLGVSAGGVGNV